MPGLVAVDSPQCAHSQQTLASSPESLFVHDGDNVLKRGGAGSMRVALVRNAHPAFLAHLGKDDQRDADQIDGPRRTGCIVQLGPLAPTLTFGDHQTVSVGAPNVLTRPPFCPRV